MLSRSLFVRLAAFTPGAHPAFGQTCSSGFVTALQGRYQSMHIEVQGFETWPPHGLAVQSVHWMAEGGKAENCSWISPLGLWAGERI